jgi:hypothetical protein
MQFKAATINLSRAIKRDPEIKKQFTALELEQIHAGVTPARFTWHHHQSRGKMQLVDAQIHHDVGHTGGRELWGGGGGNR